MHNEPFGLGRSVIIKAAMSAYSPDGLFKCSPPPEIFLYVSILHRDSSVCSVTFHPLKEKQNKHVQRKRRQFFGRRRGFDEARQQKP